MWISSLLLALTSGYAAQPPTTSSQTSLTWKPGVSVSDVSLPSLQRYKAAGVECIEIPLSQLMNGTADQQIKACQQIVADTQRAGITLWSVHLPYGKGWDISLTNSQVQQEVLNKLRKSMDLCRVLRPRKAVIHASTEPIRDEQRAARLQASRQALAGLTPEFAALGIQLALEDLPRTCLGNTSDEVLWLIRDINGLGICLDTNHLLKETPQEFIRKLSARIVTMHASDYDGKDERHWMPGEGINGWKLLVKSLAAAGYEGPFMFETHKHKDGRPIQAEEYARFVALHPLH